MNHANWHDEWVFRDVKSLIKRYYKIEKTTIAWTRLQLTVDNII